MKTLKQENFITFTKAQFFALMKIVFLGNWVANAYRTKDMKKEYEGIEDYVFSLAPKFGLDRYMDHEASDGKRYYPTRVFEEETDVHTLHEEYDEETLWDELADALGERDFTEKYTNVEIVKMSQEERFSKLSECIDIYDEEFEKFGLQRIRIQKK